MKKSIIVVVITLFACIMQLKAESLFYYGSKDSKNMLALIPNKLALCKDAYTSQEEFLQNLYSSVDIASIKWRDENMCIIETKDAQKINNLFQKRDDIVFYPLYTINGSTEAILLPEIVVKTNSSCASKTIISKYGLTLKEDRGRFQIYSVSRGNDVIKIAAQLYETGEFDFAYPHFLYSFQLFSYIPNDSYFQYQIACHNTGQMLPNGHTGTADADIDAPEAWEITKGSSDIVVAVFDQGVTSNHPDLPNTRQVRLNGSNFGLGNPNDPSATGDGNHGNACAGVIAATMDNNEGIAGIAPNSKIMPIRWDNYSDELDLANGISFAADNGANILSCSWGIENESPTLSPAIISAIEEAIEKNVTVIFSAGNTANHVANDTGYVTFPANANIPYLITVGASDRYDHVANYSPISSKIDFVAPSHRAYRQQIATETFEMWSLDIPGNDGYNPVPYELALEVGVTEGTAFPNSGTNYLAYTGYFGGTSHSCPVVAGVVALMLSVNPTLAPAEVYNILKETSDKVGGYTYTNGRCNQMGYGRVNAFEAVVAAAGGHIQGADYVCDTTKYFLWEAPTTGCTISWSLLNAESDLWHYSIVGPANQDTVYVKCIYTEPPFVLTRGVHPILSATISNGTISKTYNKQFRMPTGDTPAFSTNSTGIWYARTPRTFTITNCTDVPDSALTWTVENTTTFPNSSLPPVTSITTYTGRSITYNPPYVLSGGICIVEITATNTLKECGDNSFTRTYIIQRQKLLRAEMNNDLLKVTISEKEKDTNRQYSPACLNEFCRYTLELWHSIYGCMRIQPVHDATEYVDISGLPTGVYVLFLRENNDIISDIKLSF